MFCSHSGTCMWGQHHTPSRVLEIVNSMCQSASTMYCHCKRSHLVPARVLQDLCTLGYWLLVLTHLNQVECLSTIIIQFPCCVTACGSPVESHQVPDVQARWLSPSLSLVACSSPDPALIYEKAVSGEEGYGEALAAFPPGFNTKVFNPELSGMSPWWLTSSCLPVCICLNGNFILHQPVRLPSPSW